MKLGRIKNVSWGEFRLNLCQTEMVPLPHMLSLGEAWGKQQSDRQVVFTPWTFALPSKYLFPLARYLGA
jgi:hypothetical protein